MRFPQNIDFLKIIISTDIFGMVLGYCIFFGTKSTCVSTFFPHFVDIFMLMKVCLDWKKLFIYNIQQRFFLEKDPYIKNNKGGNDHVDDISAQEKAEIKGTRFQGKNENSRRT